MQETHGTGSKVHSSQSFLSFYQLLESLCTYKDWVKLPGECIEYITSSPRREVWCSVRGLKPKILNTRAKQVRVELACSDKGPMARGNINSNQKCLETKIQF